MAEAPSLREHSYVLVQHAETGRSLHLACGSDASVGALAAALEPTTGVAAAHRPARPPSPDTARGTV